MSEATVQSEQRARYEAWVKNEGGIEQAVHDETYKEPPQILRTAWLVENTKDVPLRGYHKDIMEFGCSNGHQLLSVNGHVGVDLNKNITDRNEILYPEHLWIAADITQPIVLRGLIKFPVHTLMLPDVLEHLEFEDTIRVIQGVKQIATHRILITIPDGRVKGKNVREVECMKHRYALTEPKLQELLSVCKDNEWKVKWETVGPFVCIRCDKIG